MGIRIFTPQELELLEQNMSAFLSYVLEHDSRPLPRCIGYCKIILKNIAVCKANQWQGIEELSEYIAADWDSAMELHTGLPEYYIPYDDYEMQRAVNTTMVNYIHIIQNCIYRSNTL